MTATLDDEVAKLRRANAELQQRLDEALTREVATAEVMGVINSSPGDLLPVFDAMLEKALELCDAAFGRLDTYDGELLHTVATRGVPAAYADFLQRAVRPAPGNTAFRLVQGEEVVRIGDMREDEENKKGDPARLAVIELGGARSMLQVGLRKDDVLIGRFVIYRTEVKPFSDKQIALLQNFAAQAVVAMENARLLAELQQRTGDLQESLEYQTATSDVLNVISRSAFDLEPILESVVTTAARLCGAEKAILYRLQDGAYRFAAGHSNEPEYERIERATPIYPGEGTVAGRAALHKRVVQIVDPLADPQYESKEEARIGNARSMIGVPMLRDGVPVGVIALARERVEPFNDRQIELVQTFADQAIIAIENARLITETREALDQQTATAEVLQVINSSPGNLTPVFDAMLERAMRLCEAAFGGLNTYDGERFRTLATRGLSPALAEVFREPFIPGLGSFHYRLTHGEALVHGDHLENPSLQSGQPQTRGVVELGGARTGLVIALKKDEYLVGSFWFYRQEVRPFSDKQIALLQNFAAQAVIAMENARLLTETREALDQQTATAEVLQVINSSPGNLEPVFNAILDKAHTFCGATRGTLFLFDGETFRAAVTQGYPEDLAERLRQGVSGSQPVFAPLLAGVRLIHNPDLTQVDDPVARVVAERGGVRTNLLLPLRKDNALLGMISCNRHEVRPFSDKEIALLENFAAQAVVAMENARLLDEIQLRQAELRVTFDNMADGVVMFDEDLRLAAWNRNFQELLDLPDAILADRPSYADYLRILAERGEFGAEDIEAELNRRLEHTDQQLRLERTRPDGRVIEVRRNSVPDGGFVLIYSDITERKRSEAEIRAARDAAEAAYRDLKAAQANLVQAEKMASLGQLTAGIAHEIKNPLNFVNNFASLSVELLEELKEATEPAVAALDDDKRAEIDETLVLLTGNLEKIAEHGKRADNIVKSMLEHSRGVSGERREVDLNQLVEEALNLAYHGARAQDQTFNITLDRDYGESLKPIEVAPQEITRVFLNLFGNGFYAANKRSHDNGDGAFRPTLTVATRDDSDAVEVRVRDNGTGIPPDIREKLFQPFFTTKPTGEGTGLGLSISYDIVTQQHGGTITVDSRVGEFTEFTVRLPRH